MKISILLVDCTEPKPDDGYYVMKECELLGCPGSHYVENYRGNKIPITDENLKNKKENIDKEIFGDVEYFVVLRIGNVDGAKMSDYNPVAINLHDIK